MPELPDSTRIADRTVRLPPTMPRSNADRESALFFEEAANLRRSRRFQLMMAR